ncbi:MAG TPA: HD domain-containing phosphohydrolase [Syntrophales bacterium]|nr:HD domain-containing phosphohydrolase [Syntrophales bacterium]
MQEKRKSDNRHYRILVVDDVKQNQELLEAHLIAEGYQVDIAGGGQEALEKVYKRAPDLILLDIQMPEIDGYQVCAKLKGDSSTRLIPIIMITALKEVADKIKAIEAGADDFITKPFNKLEVLARARSLLKVKYLNDQLDTAENVIFSLAQAIESKDKYTEGHIERVSQYSTEFADILDLSATDREAIHKGGQLHDMGKLVLDDAIINKPGRLTPEEFEMVKQHPLVGYKICHPLKSVRDALPIIRWHHEKLDGSGYPDGLKGDEIPVTVRIMAIVDVYDALTTKRSYKDSFSPLKAFHILEEEVDKGWWDGLLVQKFKETKVQSA